MDYCLNYILLDNITYLNVSCNKGALKQYNSTRREGGREAELESHLVTVTLSLAHSLPLTPSVCACVCLGVCVSQSAGCCRCAHTVWYFHSHCTIRPSIFRGGWMKLNQFLSPFLDSLLFWELTPRLREPKREYSIASFNDKRLYRCICALF